MRKSLILLGLCISFSSFAQNDEILMTIDNKPVYKSEFEYIFNKNNSKSEITKEDLDEYMDLFTKFKLKVTEAEARGLDTMPKLVSELSGYRSQLSKQYLSDSEMSDRLIEEAYERMQREVNASHILIKTSKSEDTLIAYKKIMDVYNKAIKGDDFGALAKKYSEGPSNVNGGELGWFGAFRMVYPFETAAFNTKKGDVSKPFRTRFGYHIVKINDERAARPDLNISHILIQVKPDAEADQNLKAEKKINEIHALLNSGKAYSELAKQYSDDKKSAQNGGNLGWLSQNNYFDAIVDAAYSVKNEQEYSKPIKSDIGWHIILVNNIKEIGSLEDNTSYIKSKIKRDARGQQSRLAKINQLKKEYNYSINLKAKKEIMSIFSKENFNRGFKEEMASKYQKPLITYADKVITQEYFILYVFESTKVNPFDRINAHIDDKIEALSNREVLKYEEENLENKYPQFKALMQEYTEGVLLFELTDQMVWGKAIKDTTGLNNYYDAHKNEFIWEDRVDYEIFSTSNKKYAKKAYKLSKKGLEGDSITNVINADSELNLKLESGLNEIKTIDVLKDKTWEEKLYKPVLINEKYYVINIEKLLPSQPKKLNEAKGIITSRYQDELEKQWILELNKKYKVNVNNDVLYSLIK